MLGYVMLRYFTLCYFTLRSIMLYYVKSGLCLLGCISFRFVFVRLVHKHTLLSRCRYGIRLRTYTM